MDYQREQILASIRERQDPEKYLDYAITMLPVGREMPILPKILDVIELFWPENIRRILFQSYYRIYGSLNATEIRDSARTLSRIVDDEAELAISPWLLVQAMDRLLDADPGSVPILGHADVERLLLRSIEYAPTWVWNRIDFAHFLTQDSRYSEAEDQLEAALANIEMRKLPATLVEECFEICFTGLHIPRESIQSTLDELRARER